MKRRAYEPKIPVEVLESIIYVDRNDTCLLDLDIGRGRGGYGGGGERWTIPYISRGRFMEIRSSDPLDTMIGSLDTIEIAAPVPYVSATFHDSHAGAMDGSEVRGSLALPPLNMEESREIAIRRVRSGLGEFRCHVNYCLYAVSDSN